MAALPGNNYLSKYSYSEMYMHCAGWSQDILFPTAVPQSSGQLSATEKTFNILIDQTLTDYTNTN